MLFLDSFYWTSAQHGAIFQIRHEITVLINLSFLSSIYFFIFKSNILAKFWRELHYVCIKYYHIFFPVNKFDVVLAGVEQLLCSTPEVLDFNRERAISLYAVRKTLRDSFEWKELNKSQLLLLWLSPAFIPRING